MTKPDLPPPNTKAEATAYIEAWHRLNPPPDDPSADKVTRHANAFTHAANTLSKDAGLQAAVRLLSFQP